MKKVIFVSVILFGALVFASCSKENPDNVKPTVKIIEPADDEAFKPGSNLHFKVEFSDNVALKSYKVDIHGAFDGHTHSATLATRAADESVEFKKEYEETVFIKGGQTPILGKKNATVEHTLIQIPATINGKSVKEGHYHLIVYCTDQANLESFSVTEFVISSDGHNHNH